MQPPDHLRPLHDGAECPMPPEIGECNQEGQVLLAPIPIQVHRDSDCQGHFAVQPVLLAPIPLQTSREVDCQDQFAQQQLLKAPIKQQGDRHAKGHVYFTRQALYKTVKLCKTSKTFTSVVKVALLTYFEELLIRNHTMFLILCLGHIYFVVLVKTAPFLGLKSIVFCPNYYAITANRGSIILLFL